MMWALSACGGQSVDASTSASIQYRDDKLTGNTGLVATMIADVTGGDLFSILTAEQHPDNYDDTIQAIESAEPDATVLERLALRDNRSTQAEDDVAEWLSRLGPAG